MSNKFVSKNVLKKIPDELEAKSKDLNVKESKLIKMEKELRLLASDIENDRAQIELLENSLNKKENEINNTVDRLLKEKTKSISLKEKKLNKILKITETSDIFGKFYLLIDEIYRLYVAERGDDKELLETLKLIIQARHNFCDIKSI